MNNDDSLAIRELPEYRAGLVDEPVFGGQAYVLEAGPTDGPPVVLVHGVGEAGARDWSSLIPRLARRHHVLAFDLPGFGRSTHANVNYTPKRYREFIDFVTRERVGERFGKLFQVAVLGRIAVRFCDRQVLLHVRVPFHHAPAFSAASEARDAGVI